MKNNRVITIVFLILILTANLFSAPYKEYEVKAAMMSKFPLFVRWPDNILKEINKFQLCVFGDGEISAFLKKMYKNKKIKELPVEIKSFSKINRDINFCNTLFISNTRKKQTDNIIHLFKKRPVLLISDDASLVYKGIHIGFYLHNNRVRFKINYKAMKESGISASYMLLTIGEVVAR